MQKTFYRSAIPKIFHQVWFDFGKGTKVPHKYLALQQTLRNANPDAQFVLWKEADAARLIVRTVPWFKKTYDRYPEPVYRVDAIRFVIMYAFGGCYVDFDVRGKEPIDNFFRDHPKAQKANAIVCMGHFMSHKFLENAIMMSVPGHPFWERCLRRLVATANGKHLPLLARMQKHVRVLCATGPVFYRKVFDNAPKHMKRDIYVTHPPVFFSRSAKHTRYMRHESHVTWVSPKSMCQDPLAIGILLILVAIVVGVVLYCKGKSSHNKT